MYGEKVLFLGQFSGMEILMDLHALKAPESENHIFRDWCVCVSLLSAYLKVKL